MTKPKRNKKFDSRASMPGFNSKRKRETEDFVGKFLLSSAVAFLSAVISLAVTNQINWLIVLLAFLISLIILVLS